MLHVWIALAGPISHPAALYLLLMGSPVGTMDTVNVYLCCQAACQLRCPHLLDQFSTGDIGTRLGQYLITCSRTYRAAPDAVVLLQLVDTTHSKDVLYYEEAEDAENVLVSFITGDI